MKKHLFYTIIMLWAMPIFGQYDGLIKHWGFDTNSRDKDHFHLFGSTSSQIAFSDGVQGQSVVLQDKDYWLDLTSSLDIHDDFSLIFWIRPYHFNQAQTLLYQAKEARNGVINRFLTLGISGQKLYLKTDKGGQGLYQTTSLEAQKWYQVAYTYDGFEASIYLNNQLIYKTKETSIYNELPYKEDKLFIGKKNHVAHSFQGAIDEIMIFDEKIIASTIETIFETYRPKKIVIAPVKTKVDPPKTVKKNLPKKDKYFAKTYRNRTNEIQDSIRVKSTDIAFEIWDYDKFDDDRIRLILNHTSIIQDNIPLKKKSKKRKYKITNQFVEKNANNYITFYAEDMGKYPSQNTAAVRLWVEGKKLDKIYKFVLTEDMNAVLKIVHTQEPEKEKPQPKPVYNFVQKMEVVDQLTVTHSKLLLQVRDLYDNSNQVYIKLNEDTIAEAFPLTYYAKNLELPLDEKQLNHLVIKGYQLTKKKKCRLECTIFEANKVIGKYEIRLDKTNIKIPIRYQHTNKPIQRPRHNHQLTVQDTILTIKVMDNSVIDGDVISIQQGNKLILKDYTLTKKLKTITVKLQQNAENKFLFIPISMGSKNTENTALVIIEADGRTIDKFMLSSKTKENPAVLKIVHRK